MIPEVRYSLLCKAIQHFILLLAGQRGYITDMHPFYIFYIYKVVYFFIELFQTHINPHSVFAIREDNIL
jgi:hypothetical protein